MEDYNVEDRIITKDDWEQSLNKKDQKETGERKDNVTMKFEGEWHKYPDEKPPKDGLYLITLKFGNTKDVSIGYLTKGIYSNTLTAWAELPKPYEDEI